MIGKTVGHYRITAKLGAGGMGEVFLAEDARLERKAAIKFLPADVAADPERRQRFLRKPGPPRRSIIHTSASCTTWARRTTVSPISPWNSSKARSLDPLEDRTARDPAVVDIAGRSPTPRCRP